MMDYVPPNNIEAEESVLSALLIDNKYIDDVRDILAAGDFYRTANQKIYGAMIDLYIQEKPVDLVTVMAELRSRNELETVGGAAYLSRTIEAAPMATSVVHYARLVANCSIRRKLILAGHKITQKANSLHENIDDVLDSCQQAVLGVNAADDIKHATASEDLIEIIDQLEAVWDHKILITGVPVGFGSFTRSLCGLQKSDLIILAGRPSMGKTAIAIQMVKHAADADYRPFVFSLEQPKSQLYHRLLASETRIPTTAFRSGYWSKDDWYKISDASANLAQLKFRIDDRGGLSYKEIRKVARMAKRSYGSNFFIIDHLGLVTGAGQKSRNDEVGVYTRQFKIMAKELEVPVMVLSQLSRAADGNEPKLSHLRDSGNIEQDADVVAFINRPEMYDKSDEVKGIADLIIAKQRQGPLCRTRLVWLSESTRFEMLATGEECGYE